MKLIPYVMLIALALLLAVPAGAQIPMPDPLASWFTVQVNAVEITESDPLTLTVRGTNTDNCAFPLLVNQESFDWGLRISLDRDFEAEDILCQADGAAFETVVTLTETFTSDALAQGVFIEINNYVGRLLAGPGGEGALRLEDAQRTFSTVEQLEVTDDGLEIGGNHFTGCTAPFITRTNINSDDETLTIYLYRFEQVAQQACPAMLLFFQTIILTDDLDGTVTINANNRQLVYDFEADTMIEANDHSLRMKSFTIINSVEVIVQESMPMQLQLKVSGDQPDGCQLPVIVTQQRADNVVLVEIYRELPLDVMCTMALVPYEATIDLDGGFEPGTYSISVNGTIIEAEL